VTGLPAEPRVGVVTQARTTSTRLPGKVLIEVAGRTVLDHHLDRLERSGLPVLVATTTNATDDPIARLAADRGLACHRGSETDVLARFHSCAVEHRLDVVVRVTSDCPLVDGELVASAVDTYLAADDPWLYLSNTLQRSFPRGFDFEVFSAEALADAHRNADEPAEREHVTPHLYRNPTGRMVLQNIAWPTDRSGYRLTLDTAADLELIRRLIEEYDAQRLPCGQIIALLDVHPELVALNAHVEQKRLGDGPPIG
jgi:spore coat polysaccharide biosynthesis protein SpsF